jgi:hypothetical protein
MLQSELRGGEGLGAVLDQLLADADARVTYLAYLDLVSRLTAPLVPEMPSLLHAMEARSADPRAQPEGGVYFFPPSRAPETELMKRLFGNRPIPEGFDLLEEVRDRVRAGTLDLTPRGDAGWYDLQLWSLEPLVAPDRMPESGRFSIDDEYRAMLGELFKSTYALARETHVKQLQGPPVGASPMRRDPRKVLWVAPELSVEPLATAYERRADTYRFVRGVIEETFGPGALDELFRVEEGGRAGRSLGEELTAMQSLLRGAQGTVLTELGANSAPELASPADIARFREWAARPFADPDLSRDLRMMVPVFFDIRRRKMKVWAFLGWRTREIKIMFQDPPHVEVLDGSGRDVKGAVEVRFASSFDTVPVPVVRELYVDRLLDRDEFRKLCDEAGSETKILSMLG